MASKMAGKQPEEVLQGMGLSIIQVKEKLIADAFENEPFTTTLEGTHYTEYVDKCKELRPVGTALQKRCNKLSMKVRQWKDTPEPVLVFVQNIRRKAVALADSVRVLCPDPKGSDTVNMEQVLSDLEEFKVNVPISVHVIYIRERSKDLIRFNDIDGLIELMRNQGGYLDNHFQANMHDKKLAINVEVLGLALLSLLRAVDLQAAGSKDLNIINLKSVVDTLAEPTAGYMDEIRQDLALLAKFTGNCASDDGPLQQLRKLEDES